MSGVTIKPDSIREAVQPQVHAVAEKIAETASRRKGIHRHGTFIEVVDTDEGCQVIDANPYATIDEYGSPTTPPHGAMRSAALDSGGTYTVNPAP